MSVEFKTRRRTSSGGCAAFLVGLLFTVSFSSLWAAEITVVFGGDANYPPFESLNKSGQPVGFNIELETALGQIGNARIEHQLDDWPAIIEALESGEVDVVPMFRSPEREERFTFSAPIYYANHSIYARTGTEPAFTIEELVGKRVVVERQSYAQGQLIEEGIGAELILTDNTLDALVAVANGEAEYALLALAAADQLIRKHKIRVRRIGRRLWPREYAFAVRKDRTDVAQWVSQGLALAIASGQYEHIYRHWEDELEGRELGLRRALIDAGIVLIPLLLFAGLVTLWSWSLRRTVAGRTRDLQIELERRKAAEEHLRFIANHDPHTGLAEPHFFTEQVDNALRGAKDTSGLREVTVFKLVELERIARTFGYEVVDQLVEEISRRLRALHYPACGHFGRGVFVIFSENNAGRDCFELVSSEVRVDGLEFQPNLIGGSAYWPIHGESAPLLIRHAETAMAASVASNQPWLPYDASMEPDKQDLRIVADFRRTQGEQLKAVYQPQVDLRTGLLVGAEVLVRWPHPDLGHISPAKFIPLLESTGLVAHVTARMVNEAVKMSRRLRDAGCPSVISVNVAAYDLVATDLQAVIVKALTEHGGDGHDLKLELTETSVAEDPARVRDVLQRLSQLGIAVALDDFGTGHSSLSYLSAFPIDEIKIDRSFVSNMLSSDVDRSIVRSTILLAHSLNMAAIAEGAEDETTIDALRADGCDFVQGYAVSKPLPEHDFLEFVERYRATDKY